MGVTMSCSPVSGLTSQQGESGVGSRGKRRRIRSYSRLQMLSSSSCTGKCS